MAKKTTVIPKAPFGRILMRQGAKRVSSDALDAFTDVMTDIAEEISEQAVKIAKHAGRKTVQDGDVKLASK
ncbi:MAG: histone family protein [Candidatus Nanoarchaeia archaeon]